MSSCARWVRFRSLILTVKPHYEIAEALSLVDFERGVKISGARFYVYNEQIARLERQLANFMLDLHAEAGYKERMVPLVVKDECMFGTGQFPKFADEYYRMDKDGLSLIPTGEVPLTNIYADEILNADQLPIKLTALTPCFRREAGSAGKDTRGLIRVHQFNKVELVKFVRPEESEKEWISLTNDAERVLQKLGLTYRVLSLCSGDMGFTSSITYDLEVYMPGLGRWLEISSCSNFKDFQARRAKIRYKNEAGKNEYVHTINGSGVAAGRLIAALLEYHQTPYGKVDWAAIEAKLSGKVGELWPSYGFKNRQKLHGERFDKVVHALLAERVEGGVSRGMARKLIMIGAAYLNGSRCRIASKPVFSGIEVRVEYKAPEKLQAQQLERARPHTRKIFSIMRTALSSSTNRPQHAHGPDPR